MVRRRSSGVAPRAALVAVLAAVGTLAFGAAAVSVASAQAPGSYAVPVEAQEVKVQPVVDTIHSVGTLHADQSIIVRPEIAGVITRIHFEEGQKVEAGAQLFSLDDSIYRAELAEAEANLRLSMRNYSRASELFERKVGTARARDEALSKLEVDKAAIALAKARLAKTRIYAPFAGIAGLREVDLGAYVTAGQDLVSLDDVDPLEINFEVPERYARFIHAGQAVKVLLDAFPGQEFSGEIVTVSPRVNAAGRSLSVLAQMPNAEGTIRPGLFARVAVVVDRRQNALVVPEQAIVPQGESLYVYTVVDGKARMTQVKVGLRVYGQAEIVEGLEKGDMVVTAGQMKIRDGAPVAILGAKGAGG